MPVCTSQLGNCTQEVHGINGCCGVLALSQAIHVKAVQEPLNFMVMVREAKDVKRRVRAAALKYGN